MKIVAETSNFGASMAGYPLPIKMLLRTLLPVYIFHCNMPLIYLAYFLAPGISALHNRRACILDRSCSISTFSGAASTASPRDQSFRPGTLRLLPAPGELGPTTPPPHPSRSKERKGLAVPKHADLPRVCVKCIAGCTRQRKRHGAITNSSHVDTIVELVREAAMKHRQTFIGWTFPSFLLYCLQAVRYSSPMNLGLGEEQYFEVLFALRGCA